jgi:hypothetical protein
VRHWKTVPEKRPVYPEKELEVQQPKPQIKEENRQITDTGKNRAETVRRRKRGKVILTTLLTLAIVSGFYFGVKAIIVRVWSTATVPNVIGLNIEDAERILNREGTEISADICQRCE